MSIQETDSSQIKDIINNDIDLKELFDVLYQGKWVISSITAIAAVIGVLYSLSLPNIYLSSALLAPVDSSDGLSSNLKSYSGLASIAGIDLSSKDNSSNSLKAMEKINSLSFFENNILPNIFLPELMAVEYWSAEMNLLKFDEDIYIQSSNTWTRKFAYPQKQTPSAQESFKRFLSHISISEDKQTGFVTLDVKHQSPFVAKGWAELLIEQINAFYRQKDKLKAEKAVTYLNAQILRNNFTEIKMVFAEILQQEIQKLTLIEANDFYVFDYIDPPAVMEKKSEPGRALICIVYILLGAMLGVLVVLIRYYWPKKVS